MTPHFKNYSSLAKIPAVFHPLTVIQYLYKYYDGIFSGVLKVNAEYNYMVKKEYIINDHFKEKNYRELTYS